MFNLHACRGDTELYRVGGAIKVEITESLAKEICYKVHRGTVGIPYDFIGFCEAEGDLKVSDHVELALSYLKLSGNEDYDRDFEYIAALKHGQVRASIDPTP